jgi:multiple sugar transport system permease protein
MADTTVVQPQALPPAGPLGRPVPPAPVADRSDDRWWKRLPFYLGLAVATVAFCYPLLWLVSASLKPKSQVFDNKLVPETIQFSNYVEVWKVAPVVQWLVNSITVGLMAALAVTLSSAAVAFGFAYFRFRLRGPLFGLVLATMMLPGAVTMIPVYLIWNEISKLTGEAGALAALPDIGVNTQYPLWLPNMFGSAFYIFLMRQFFLGIPRDLFEAARIDGDGYFSMFRRIALPLAKPALIVVFIFELQAKWFDLMTPLIYLRDSALYTLPLGLKTILDAQGAGGGGEGRWEIIMAGTVITVLPMVILFAIFQRYFIEGIATQGRKG